MLRPGATIGIIGGGQLGRMLAMAAARLGFRTVVLEPEADCPAAQVANRQVVAGYDDEEALDALAAACDVITYEFENVPVKSAQRLAAIRPVFPPPRALEISQDRLVEKRFLNSIGIATAPFAPVDSVEDLRRALAGFGGTGLLKTRRMGYDGKGQVRIGGEGPTAEDAFAAIAGAPAILEALVDFAVEVSVIAARDAAGGFAAFDVTENVHRSGILATSTVPARVTPETADLAQASAASLLGALDYVGIIGVEFFVARGGSLLANEFAPRVHNSGHWTEAACAVSQFEQHVRAIAGLPLAAPLRHCDCIMENLIGADVGRVPAILAEPNAVLHLYGKAEVRPGRKMGHVTRLLPRTERSEPSGIRSS
jgi:5-(carboxyamino)imidazole ribonucleotide synthase